MRPAAAGLALTLAVLAAPAARAQPQALFGSGKPPAFREERPDRAFARTQVAKLLQSGLKDLDEAQARGCAQLLGGLLTALAEVGPSLNKASEDFYLDPALLAALQEQLGPAGFPSVEYLQLMVRRVMIDRRLPEAWLATATALAPALRKLGATPPDLGKLRLLAEGVAPVDSVAFTLPVLQERYAAEVRAATSAAAADALTTFRDTYLDRDVAWAGVVLVDVGLNQRRGARARLPGAPPEALVAVLHWRPPEPRKTTLDLLAHSAPRAPTLVLHVRLQPRQVLDLDRLAKGQRLLVKGRLWEMTRTLSEVELRDAVLLRDPDWSEGARLGNPDEVALCPAAVNELPGAVPQSGGFER